MWRGEPLNLPARLPFRTSLLPSHHRVSIRIMPPKPGPAVPAASRRAKRIIESASPSPSPEVELEPELELEADEVDDEEDELPDADYESEEDPLAFRSAGPSHPLICLRQY